jgi:hypothetical protein
MSLAEQVKDLSQAKRLIAQLEGRIAELEASASPAQEPIGMLVKSKHGDFTRLGTDEDEKQVYEENGCAVSFLYATPPAAQDNARDTARLDWLEKAYQGEHEHAPYFNDGLWRFPYLVSGAGGYGGGVGEATFNTLREAIDAALRGEGEKNV